MKNQYKSSIIKNHNIKRKYLFGGVPLKKKKKAFRENQMTNDA